MKLKQMSAVFLVLASLLLVPFSKNSSGASKEEVIVLSKSNTLVLSGEVDGESTGAVMTKAKELNKKWTSKPIYLFLNTPGGEIQTGLEMLEALHGSARPIDTVTLFSASMGFQIVQNLGERLILKNGILMSHRAAGQISGYFGGQLPSQMDSRYKLWLQRINELDQQTVSRTKGKQTLQSYQKAYADELWLTGSQAVEQGYADRIVTARCDSSLDGITSHSLSFFGLQISYDLDNCPLNTSPMNIRVAAPQEKNAKPMTASEIEDVKERFVRNYNDRQRAALPLFQQ